MSRNVRLCERWGLTELIQTFIGCAAASFTQRHSLSHSVSGSLVRLTPSSSSYIDVTAVRAVLCRVFDVAVVVDVDAAGERSWESTTGVGSKCVRASLVGERRGRRGKPRVRRAAYPPSLLYFKLPYTVVQRSICFRSLAVSHWHIRSRYTMIAPCLLLNVRTKASLLVFSICISVSVAFLQLLCFPCLACLPLSFYKFSLDMIKTNSVKSALRFRASDHLCM